ncbi:MAG: methyltransferase domain-containing protein [Desulfovibrio sp.]
MQHVGLNRVPGVRLRPFTSVRGRLAGERREGDARLTLVKQPCFHNDNCVRKNKDHLLNTEPEQWDNSKYPLVLDRYESIRDIIDRNLRIAPRTILELGCGLGRTTHRLALEYPDARVVGYDFSPHSIEVCRKSFNLPNLSFETGDFTHPLPHGDGEADLIVSIAATNMSAAPVVTAGEYCRLLSEHGVAVDCTLSESGFAYWDFPASLFLPVHMNTFPGDWFSVAHQAGLHFSIEPWNLSTFTFIACADEEFRNAHAAYGAAHSFDPLFRLHQERFAIAMGRHIEGVLPEGDHEHLLERSYPAFVRRCLASLIPEDAELVRLTGRARALVAEKLALLPGAARFIDAVLAGPDNAAPMGKDGVHKETKNGTRKAGNDAGMAHGAADRPETGPVSGTTQEMESGAGPKATTASRTRIFAPEQGPARWNPAERTPPPATWPCKVCGASARLAFTRDQSDGVIREAQVQPQGYARPYYACPRCRMLFHVGFDVLTPEQSEVFHAPGSGDAIDKQVNRAVREVTMVDAFLRLHNLPGNSKVLVFGCGGGLSYNYLLGLGLNVWASDISLASNAWPTFSWSTTSARNCYRK